MAIQTGINSNMDSRIMNLNQMEEEAQRRDEAYEQRMRANMNNMLNNHADPIMNNKLKREQAQARYDQMAQDVRDWGNIIADVPEPTPLHMVLEEWLKKHYMVYEFAMSKVDMDMNVQDRLPMAILAILWTARKKDKTTGNQVVDTINRELEVAARSKKG